MNKIAKLSGIILNSSNHSSPLQIDHVDEPCIRMNLCNFPESTSAMNYLTRMTRLLNTLSALGKYHHFLNDLKILNLFKRLSTIAIKQNFCQIEVIKI